MCESPVSTDVAVDAGGHGIRFQTVPNKAMESDGRQGLITLVYLQRPAQSTPKKAVVSTMAEMMVSFEV